MSSLNFDSSKELNDVVSRFKQDLDNAFTSKDQNSFEYKQVLDQIRVAITFREQKYNQLIYKLRKFIAGQGWDVIEPNGTANRKESEFPQLIQTVKSSMISVDNIIATCAPSRTEGSKALAANLSDILNAIFSDNINKREIHKAKIESRGLPMSITFVESSDGNDSPLVEEGKICFKNIPIEKFWWQPSAIDINKCDYVFVGDIWSWEQLNAKASEEGMNASLIAELYAGCLTSAYGSNKKVNAADSAMNRIYYDYFKYIEPNIKATDINYKVPVYLFYRRVKENKQWVVYKYYIAYNCIVGKQKLNITALPFAILKEFNLESSFYGRSSVEIGLPCVQALMVLDSTIADAVSNTLTKTWLVPESFNVDKWKKAKAKGDVFISVTDQSFKQFGENQMVELNPYVFNENILNLRSALLEELQTIVGINQITLGEGFGSATNGSAVNSMINQSTARDYDSIQEFSFYLHRLALLSIDAITNDYLSNSDSITYFIPNKDGTDYTREDAFKPVVIDKDAIKAGIGSVVINTQMLRTDKADLETANLMTLYQISVQNAQKYGTEPIITEADIIERMNLANKKEILERATLQNDMVKISEVSFYVDKAFKLASNPLTANLSKEIAAALIQQEYKTYRDATARGEQPVSQIDQMAVQQDQAAEQMAVEQAMLEQQAMLEPTNYQEEAIPTDETTMVPVDETTIM